MKQTGWFCAALAGLSLLSAPALAEDTGQAPGQCFSMREFQNWKAPDARTIYIRVGVDRYYRLDLAAPCQSLTRPDTHLITKVRGSDWMCKGIDWDLSVAQSLGTNVEGFRQACIVKTQTPLSPAEAAAIPQKFKP